MSPAEQFAFDLGYGLEKTAGSALRSLVKLVKGAPGRDNHTYDLMLKSRPIGHIRVEPGMNGNTVRSSYIDPKYQGLGLGKKMYGDLLKQIPGNRILSDSSVSPDAQRVWSSMKSNPSYTVTANPAAKIRPGGSTALADPDTISHYNNKLQATANAEQSLLKRVLGYKAKVPTVPTTDNHVFSAKLNLPPNMQAGSPR